MTDHPALHSGDELPVLGIILAGGLSSRMQFREKTLLELAGTPMIAHVIERMHPQVAALAINANGAAGRFEQFGLPVVADESEDRAGPLAGVLAGMVFAAGQGFSHIVTAAADTPFLPMDLVDRLRRAAAGSGMPIALAATETSGGETRRHPTFGLWPVCLAGDLRRALGEGTRKVLLWTEKHGAAVALFDAGPPDPFFNVNRPQELIDAEQLVKAGNR